ncbi:MAG: hypothetical protein VX831_02335 [Candidatus Thermoplasmatota archaeon]|nr:hypothetical protein [Candidatus Thermoplasmatota archaeon]
MKWIRFSDLGEDPRSAMQGQRWLVMTAHDLPHATAALAFSELEDVLVAVDHRGVPVEHGLWMRAVHLMVVGDTSHAAALQASSGITQVLASDAPVETHLW